MKKLTLLLVFVALIFAMCKKDKKQSSATVTTSAITDITSSSAKSGGTITDDGGSTITKKGLCWANHANPTVADSITDEGSGNAAFTKTLSSLKANTTYYVKAYAINASGTAYGNEVNFKTNAGLATVTTTAMSDIVALSAKGGGEIVNDGGASVTERGLVYGTSANPTTSSNKIAVGTGTGTFTTTLSPLASQQTYYVRAYAITSYGTSYGNQVQFNAASASTVTDIDGNVYPYVTVCGKDWMATNLKTTRYKNGDNLINAHAVTNYNWYTSTSGAYTFPNGDPSTDNTLGKLYSNAVVMDSRGVCPTGWHIASDNDWKALEVCQGMTQADADKEGARGTIGAKLLDGGSSGVNIKKAGNLFYNSSSSGYYLFDKSGIYWTSTVFDPFDKLIYYRAFNLTGTDPAPITRNTNTTVALSIRCVKD